MNNSENTEAVIASVFFLSCKSHSHNGDDQDNGECPDKKGDAVDDERQQRILVVKVKDAFHRLCF